MRNTTFLDTLTRNAIAFNNQPIQFQDVYGSFNQGRELERQDSQRQRAADLQAELEDVMGSMENPTEEDIYNASLKVRTKYGDDENALKLMQQQQRKEELKLQSELQAQEKQRKELMDIAKAAEIDPALARQLKGQNSPIDDGTIDRIYKNENSRRTRGSGEGGGSEKFVYMYTPDGRQVTVTKDRKSVDEALANGLSTQKPDFIMPPKQKGEDIAAREESRKEPGFAASLLGQLKGIFTPEEKAIIAMKEGTKEAIDPKTGRKIIVNSAGLKKKNK